MVRPHAALHDFGQISQVEGVVAFGGRGQHLRADCVVCLDSGGDEGLADALDGLIEVTPADT